MSEEKEQDVLINAVKMKKGIIQIDYTKGSADFSGDFRESPDPRFTNAMLALKNSVAEILELPNESERLIPFAVKFRYTGDGTIGATISAALALDSANQKVTINTPFRWADKEDGHNKKCLNPAQVEMLETLIREAQEYLTGHKAQTSLFNQDGTVSDDQTPVDAPAA